MECEYQHLKKIAFVHFDTFHYFTRENDETIFTFPITENASQL